MKEEFDFLDWIFFTFFIALMLGVVIASIVGLVLFAYEFAIEYKYGVFIEIYLIICGSIAYWMMRGGTKEKEISKK